MLLCTTLSVWLFQNTPINNDVAWYFEVCRRILSGERLYSGIIEVNVPAAVFAYFPPVLLAETLGGGARVWLASFIAIFVLLLTWTMDGLLVDPASDSLAQRAWRITIVMLVFILLPGGDLGQREHLAALFLTLYLFTRLDPRAGARPARPAAVLIVIAAGFAVALKPHFLLPWAAIELSLLKRGRKRSDLWYPVVVAFPTVLQVLLVPLLFLPLIEVWSLLGPLYARFSSIPVLFMFIVELVFAPAAVLVIYICSKFSDGRAGDVVWSLLVAAGAWMIVGVIQRKGFSYHVYPGHANLALAAGLLAVSGTLIRRSAWNDLRRALCLASSILVMVLHHAIFGRLQLKASAAREEIVNVLDGELKSGSTTLVLAMNPSFVYPLLPEFGLHNAGSFPALWPLQPLYRDSAQAGPRVHFRLPREMDEAERFLFERVVADVESVLPDYILVRQGPESLLSGASFDYLEYFLQSPKFAELLSCYSTAPGPSGMSVLVLSQSACAAGRDRVHE